MVVIHYTDDDELLDDWDSPPKPIDTAGEGPGLWVYPARNAPEPEDWYKRRMTRWEIAPQFTYEVQRFEKGEFDGVNPPHRIIELFIPAQHFDKLVRLD